jgi:hypothetical protein
MQRFTSTCRPRVGSLFVAVACSLTTLEARAQASAESAAAQALFDDARGLMAQGRAAEACPKLEESQRLDPGSGTLVNLAKCYEETHRLASAWSTYLDAAAAAKTAGNSERESGARALAAALAPRVSKLIVSVAPEANVPDLQVLRDQILVGAPQWGIAIPVDEGDHAIVAKAPGFHEWETTARVTGEGATVTVVVPLLARAEQPSPAPANPTPSSGGEHAPVSQPAPSRTDVPIESRHSSGLPD